MGFFSTKKEPVEKALTKADITAIVAEAVGASKPVLDPTASLTALQVVQLQKYAATLGLEAIAEKCVTDNMTYTASMDLLMGATIKEIGDLQTSQHQFNQSTGELDVTPLADSTQPTNTSEALAAVMSLNPKSTAKQCLDIAMKRYPDLYNAVKVTGNGAGMVIPEHLPSMLGSQFDRNPVNKGVTATGGRSVQGGK